MHRLFAALFVVSALACAAAAHAQAAPDTGAYRLKVTVDEFDKSRSVHIMIAREDGADHNIDSKCTTEGASVVTFTLDKSEKPGKPPLVLITSDYNGPEWLYIGETPLQILADGALVEFEPFVKDRKVRGAGDLYEIAGYTATADKLQKLARATTLKIRMPGGRGGNCVYSLKPASIAGLRQFVTHEVPPS
jgi:hypothetical protein